MIIVGNWKTYIKTEEEAKQLAEKITLVPNTTVIICPSSVHIPVVSKTLKDKGVGLGAQRISTGENSADTGGLSAEQLNDFNIERVIIGHSERRDKGVTDEDVVHMTCYALKNNLFPIICVSNLQQVNNCLEGMKKEGCLLDIKKCIIAYEPIEYIGADAPMKSEDILNETVNIRLMIQKITTEHIPVLYGGSVSSDNVQDVVEKGKVDGFLVGRASVDLEEWNSLIKKIAV